MRCFIGVPVEGPLAARLRGQPLPGDARAVRGRDLHLTLAFLGEREEQWARTLWPPLQRALAGLPAFSVPLTGVGAFPRPGGRIWAASVAPAATLLELHETVWRVLERRGLDRERRRFRPHLTLARAAAPITAPPRPLDDLLPVTKVVFYQSPGEGGAYRRLAVWALE